MKVMLISPYSDSHYNVPPISLGYIAKGLLDSGFDVKIVDGVKDHLNYERLNAIIDSYGPKFIGLQVYSCNVGTVQEYVKQIQDKYPNLTIILGGPHVSGVKGDIFMEFKSLEYAFHGEVDTNFPIFLKKLVNKEDISNTKGLIWQKAGKVSINQPHFEDDLDKIGMPAWELMDPRAYKGAPQGAVFRNKPVAPILTSRGCPYNCTFCANHITHGRKVRMRDIKQVINEVEHLQKKYGVKEIHIIDDNFASNKARVLEFCQGVIERGLKFTLTFPNGIRLNSLDEEVLENLKKIGCYSVIVGIESGSQKILNDMKKSLTLDIIEKKVKLITSYGIDVTGFFIIGYPTETPETIEETINFAKKLKLKRAHFSLFLPLPGTEITEQLKKEGKIKDIDWSRLSYTNTPFVPEGMTEKQLKKYQHKAFHSFYFRPKIMYYMLREIKSIEQLKMLLKRAMDYGFKGAS